MVKNKVWGIFCGALCLVMFSSMALQTQKPCPPKRQPPKTVRKKKSSENTWREPARAHDKSCPEVWVDPNTCPVITKDEPLERDAQKRCGKDDSDFTLHPETISSCVVKEPNVLAHVRPATAVDDSEDRIEVQFDKLSLVNLLKWVEETYDISIISDDILTPPPAGSKSLAGNIVSFKTNQPMTKRQVWDLFVTFLDLFDMTIVRVGSLASKPELFRIVSQQGAHKLAPPSYINVSWRELPDNDAKIRYVYFFQNSTVAGLQDLINSMRSSNASWVPLPEINAFMITDKASNIRGLMEIITELDSVTMPEAMSVLKLRHASAEDVQQLYDTLTKGEESKGVAARILGQKKPQTASYFPTDTRLIAESRTNSLIVLGTKEGIEKVENFIKTYVDTELAMPYSPLHVYDLQFANAPDVAQILNAVVQFSPGTPAAQFGGTRDGDKYLRPITIIPEPDGNRLLIKAEKDDYSKVKEIIQKIDVKQPQIAIEVLIVNVFGTDTRELGVQIRNKRNDTINRNIEFQTSGLPNNANPIQSIIVSPTGDLMGNLIQLAKNQVPGVSLLSFGTENTGGVWALFRALQTRVQTNVVSAPFLTTVNKFTATVSLGEIRYVQSGLVKGAGVETPTFDNVEANVTVKITPQINSDGIINMNIEIHVDEFSNATDPASANRNVKKVITNASLGNKEILAVGGLIKGREVESTSKVPILGDIPLIGWVFKNKQKLRTKDNLIVFISPRIIEPRLEGGANPYTCEKATEAKALIALGSKPAERRDPIHRWFFKDRPDEGIEHVDNFMARKHHGYTKNPCPSPMGCASSVPEAVDDDFFIGSYPDTSPSIASPVGSTGMAVKESLLDFVPAESEVP